MVNVGLSPGSILGIVIAVAGGLLYFLRSWRPELARDHDIFFAAVGLLCGGILFFQGWRLDPILLFGQLLLSGASIFFAADSIRLRSVATDQARRNTPIVDDDRPVSRVYRAELDEFDSFDEEPPVRRIRSAREGSARSRTGYTDELEGEARSTRRLTSKRSGTGRPPGEGSASGKRRPPRPESGYSDAGYSEDLDNNTSSPRPPSERRPRPSSNRPPSDRPSTDRTERPSPPASGRPPRKRPRPESPPASDGDYVDYQPLDYPDGSDYNSESDNSSNFDEDR
jgi:Ycf66 protein N-terminus